MIGGDVKSTKSLPHERETKMGVLQVMRPMKNRSICTNSVAGSLFYDVV